MNHDRKLWIDYCIYNITTMKEALYFMLLPNIWLCEWDASRLHS